MYNLHFPARDSNTLMQNYFSESLHTSTNTAWIQYLISFHEPYIDVHAADNVCVYILHKTTFAASINADEVFELFARSERGDLWGRRFFRNRRRWPFQAAVVLHLLSPQLKSWRVSRQQYITQIMKEWKTFSFAHKLARRRRRCCASGGLCFLMVRLFKYPHTDGVMATRFYQKCKCARFEIVSA